MKRALGLEAGRKKVRYVVTRAGYENRESSFRSEERARKKARRMLKAHPSSDITLSRTTFMENEKRPFWHFWSIQNSSLSIEPLWKPQRIVAGVSDPIRQSTISRLAMRQAIETAFATEADSIMRLSEEKLPSIAIVDLASSEYDALDCCHRLEWNPDIIVFCLYPEDRRDLLDEAYGCGFDVSSDYSGTEKELLKILSGSSSTYKVRQWMEK